jgi:enoyl-[acyl-carrier protein] reductase III
MAKAGDAPNARESWSLILGASSGMGEATSRALAAAGDNICGIHLDFRAALAHVDELKSDLAKAGANVLFINMNAADDEKRGAALDQLAERFEAARAAGRQPELHVVMHSLAFGSLVPFLTAEARDGVDRKKMEMTQDVMANSLVYWVQDLFRRGLIGSSTRIFAMTSEGSSRVVPSYGVVSSAKAALESHVRQLAMELARAGTGATINAIRAGVTDTPALRKIPEAQQMIEITMRRNPTGRMTTPKDVADAIVALAGPGGGFINGDTISVDGGEFVTGS